MASRGTRFQQRLSGALLTLLLSPACSVLDNTTFLATTADEEGGEPTEVEARFTGNQAVGAGGLRNAVRTIMLSLSRGQAPEDFFTQRPLPDPGDEVLDDLEMDVRFQQRQPDLAEPLPDVRFREMPLPPELPEDPLKLLGKPLEHGPFGSASLTEKTSDCSVKD